MEITHRFEFVDGSFDTDTGKMACVSSKKHSSVSLCFQGNINISFARIRLHSNDLFSEAEEVFDSAKQLGEEIARRWNKPCN